MLLHRGWFHYIALRPTCFFCRHACFRRCLHRRHYPHSPFCCPQSAQQVIVYKQHFNVGQQCRLFSPQCRRHLRKDVLKRRNTLKRLYIRFRRSSTARNGRAADRLRGRFEFFDQRPQRLCENHGFGCQRNQAPRRDYRPRYPTRRR